jgi:hypothetical protein
MNCVTIRNLPTKFDKLLPSIQGMQSNIICMSNTTYLYRKYDDSAIWHHVQEERHGFILMRWVSIKRALCHNATTGLVQYHHVDASALMHFSILQNLASYTNIKFLSSKFIVLIARKASC